MSADLDREYQARQNEQRKRLQIREELWITFWVIGVTTALYLGIGVVIDALPIW